MSAELTKDEARHVLAAHLAFEEAGGDRAEQWYAGTPADYTGDREEHELGPP